MLAYLWVAIGGALGSVARFGLNGLVSARFGETFRAYRRQVSAYVPFVR